MLRDVKCPWLAPCVQGSAQNIWPAEMRQKCIIWLGPIICLHLFTHWWIPPASIYLLPDMHCPTLQNVTFWRATRCGWWIFDKKFEKMPKITISWCKMYKPGNSGWNQISVLPDDHFLSNIGHFLLFVTMGSVPSSKKLTTEKCKQQAKMHQNKNFRQIHYKHFFEKLWKVDQKTKNVHYYLFWQL